MGWDYFTYMSQPVFFIDAIKEFFIQEHKAQRDALRKQQEKQPRVSSYRK